MNRVFFPIIRNLEFVIRNSEDRQLPNCRVRSEDCSLPNARVRLFSVFRFPFSVLRSPFSVLFLFLSVVMQLQAFDFRKTIGDVDLYFTVNDFGKSTVTVVCPGEKESPYEGVARQPKGRLVIPQEVQYDGQRYFITAIGDYAFAGCTQLTYISIPRGVSSIGRFAFAGCEALHSIEIACDSLGMVDASFRTPSEVSPINIDTITVSSTVRVLPAFFFCEMEHLRVFNFNAETPESMKYIFFGLKSETVIRIGDNVTEIPAYMCYNFEGLRTLEGGDRVKSIGENAFVHCINLQTIRISTSVECLGNSCFAYNKPESIVFESVNMPHVGDNPFIGVDKGTAVYIPCQLRMAYVHSIIGRYFPKPLLSDECHEATNRANELEIIYFTDTVYIHDTVVVHDTVWMTGIYGSAIRDSVDARTHIAQNIWIEKNSVNITVTDFFAGETYSIYDVDGQLVVSGRLPEKPAKKPFVIKLPKKARFYLTIGSFNPFLLDMPNKQVHI